MADGRVERVSARWWEYAGLDWEKDHLPNWELLVHPEDVGLCIETWGKPVQTTPHDGLEVRLKRWDGSYEWHLMSATPPLATTFNRWSGTCTSIATLKERESSLIEAKRVRDEFLGMIAHELRGPLAILVANTRLLLHPPVVLEREEETTSLKEIEREALRVLDRLENLLALSRPDAAVALETDPILVQHIVRRVVDEHLSRFPGRPIAVNAPGRAAPANGVATFIDEILANLLTNAEKYTDPASPIEIEVREKDDSLLVSVLDRGTGIKAEDLDRVFDPFVQLGQDRRTAMGVGLGLAVCRKLAKAQGGTIRAERRPGGGTIFLLALPLWPRDGGALET